jgi:hypothetical protein
MNARKTLAGIQVVLAVALLTAGCTDSLAPRPQSLGGSRLEMQTVAAAGGTAGLVLDQQNSTLDESGTTLIKGFNPTNPHHGDAIVATFVWTGSTNIITSVTDVETSSGFPVVGNTYNLVEYVTSGGISMATYLATNVQGFPDPNDPSTGVVLAVRATLSQSVTDGGVVISAYSGLAVTLGAHHSASGSGNSTTTADPGAIPVTGGGLAYGISFTNGLVGVTPPAGFTNITNTSDASFKGDAEYAVQASAGSVDPQWTWFFNSPSTWLGSVVALTPAATHLAFTVQPSTTLPYLTITPAVQVTALDGLGNPVPSFNGSVTIAIGNNGGLVTPGTLSGTLTVAFVNGVATFSDLSINQLGNGYTLAVTSSGLTGAVSAPFDIGAN